MSFSDDSCAPQLSTEPKLNKQDNRALTGLKAVAATLIAIHHVGLIMLPLRQSVFTAALGKCALPSMTLFCPEWLYDSL